MTSTALFDLDGTLVDSNYHHALAWSRAFRTVGLTPALWRIHRCVGMGGDQLVEQLVGAEVEALHGVALRAAWRAAYDDLIDEVVPFEGATDVLRVLAEHDVAIVLASSSPQEHAQHYIDLLQAQDLIHAWTTSDDVATTKPAPDLIDVALSRSPSDAGTAVLVGDSPWDVKAALRAGVPTVAVRTGGFGVDELTAAGAAVVLDELSSAAPVILSLLQNRQ